MTNKQIQALAGELGVSRAGVNALIAIGEQNQAMDATAVLNALRALAVILDKTEGNA